MEIIQGKRQRSQPPQNRPEHKKTRFKQKAGNFKNPTRKTDVWGTRRFKSKTAGLEKAVVAVAEEFEEFHVAEFLELLANFGLNVSIVRMELSE